ncbi:MAG: DUF362 domain-containing protein [Firmicutes bacterium]|nr:DUF362 domain-containing protein [Bacillota bacterium]
MNPVYFSPLPDGPAIPQQVIAIQKVMAAGEMAGIIAPHDFVAVKIHVGEGQNNTYIKPDLIKAVVDLSKTKSGLVFLTETSTLYKGQRSNAVDHIRLASRHGFGMEAMGAPFIMADGLTGGSEIEVPIGGEIEKSVKIAREAVLADVLIAVSHPTGHLATGLGACLKNLGMGLASRAGKLRQHSSIKPRVNTGACRFCQKCLQWCPASAILGSGQKARILTEKCIGCGECLTVCRYDAIEYNWGAEPAALQKIMAEHAFGAVKNKLEKCFYINVLVDMTQDCDCMGYVQKKLIPDIGILASKDPVAIDKATLDLTEKANGKSLAKLAKSHLNPMVQLEHAAKLGMGNMEYQLVEV